MYFWFLLTTVLKSAFRLSLVFQFYIAGLEMLRSFSVIVKEVGEKKIIKEKKIEVLSSRVPG